jgi:hypothetical protein
MYYRSKDFSANFQTTTTQGVSNKYNDQYITVRPSMKILKLLFFHDVKITVIGSIAQSRQSAKLFLKSSELGLPHPHTRLRERGVESPNSDEGTYIVILNIV